MGENVSKLAVSLDIPICCFPSHALSRVKVPCLPRQLSHRQTFHIHETSGTTWGNNHNSTVHGNGARRNSRFLLKVVRTARIRGFIAFTFSVDRRNSTDGNFVPMLESRKLASRYLETEVVLLFPILKTSKDTVLAPPT